MLYARTDYVYGSSAFDDFQVEEAAANSGYNYLTNGDFEWMDEWTLPTGGSQASVDPVYGSYNLKIVGKPTEKRAAYTTIPMNVSANNTFVLSGWAIADSVASIEKADSSGRSFGLEAVITYTDSTTETHFVSFDGGNHGLQFVSGNVVPKEPSKTIKTIKVSCVYNNNNANTAYFDNISLHMEPINCYSYDEDGHLVSATQKGSETLDFSYSSGNLIQEVTEGNGVYDYEYDDNHNLTKATNDGVEMNLTYDHRGHVTASSVSSEDSAAKIETGATYTYHGHYLRTQTDAAGNVTTYTTNGYGLTFAIQDAAGNTTSYAYNTSNDRLTKVSLDDGTAVNYTYGNGVLESIVRNSLLPDGTANSDQTYSFTYDTYGNVSAVKVGTQTLASYEYCSKNGPLKKITYGNGYTIEYGHDVLGRVVTESHDGVLKYRYVYGSTGELASRTEVDSSGTAVSAVCYEYDSLGRLIRSWEESSGNGYLERDLATEHLYDTSDRLTQQSWQYDDGTTKTEKYTYNNDDGTLTSVTPTDGFKISLTYDALKRLSTRSNTKFTATYAYRNIDSDSTTTQVSGLTYSGLTDALAYSYTYDSRGNITQIKENGTVVAAYTYDEQSQLIKEVLTDRTIKYSYDTAGNIRSVATTQNGVTDTVNYKYEGDNEWYDLLTVYDGHNISYDKVGNPKSYHDGDQRWTLTWTEDRKLATAVAANTGTSVSYTYDADGYRETKTVDGVTYEYTYLGGKLVKQA